MALSLLLTVFIFQLTLALDQGPIRSTTKIGCGGDFAVPVRLVLTGDGGVERLCRWNILPQGGQGVLMDFQRNDIGSCKPDAYGTPKSYVAIWTGTTLLGPYCGSNLPPLIPFQGKISAIVKAQPRPLLSVIFEAVAYTWETGSTPACSIKGSMEALHRCNPKFSNANMSGEYSASSFGSYQWGSDPINSTQDFLKNLFIYLSRFGGPYTVRFATQQEWAPYVVGALRAGRVVCGISIGVKNPVGQWLVSRVTDTWTLDHNGIVNGARADDICSADPVQYPGTMLYACRQLLSGTYIVVQSYCVSCQLDLTEVLAFTQKSLADDRFAEW